MKPWVTVGNIPLSPHRHFRDATTAPFLQLGGLQNTSLAAFACMGVCICVFPCVLWLSGTSDRCGRKSLFIFPEAVTEVEGNVCMYSVFPGLECSEVQIQGNNSLYVPVRGAPTCCNMSFWTAWVCVCLRLSTSHTQHCYTVMLYRMSSLLHAAIKCMGVSQYGALCEGGYIRGKQTVAAIVLQG